MCLPGFDPGSVLWHFAPSITQKVHSEVLSKMPEERRRLPRRLDCELRVYAQILYICRNCGGNLGTGDSRLYRLHKQCLTVPYPFIK